MEESFVIQIFYFSMSYFFTRALGTGRDNHQARFNSDKTSMCYGTNNCATRA